MAALLRSAAPQGAAADGEDEEVAEAAGWYSLEVDEDIFDGALLPTQAASSHGHLVVDVMEADGGATLAC